MGCQEGKSGVAGQLYCEVQRSSLLVLLDLDLNTAEVSLPTWEQLGSQRNCMGSAWQQEDMGFLRASCGIWREAGSCMLWGSW